MPEQFINSRNSNKLTLFVLLSFLTIALYPQENNHNISTGLNVDKQFADLFKTGEELKLKGAYEDAK